MKFARVTFLVAGIYGLVVLLPQYFLEARIGRDSPPPITHPEFYYGFVGVGLAWQIAFLVISRDPVRYRLLMLPSILEKVTFGVAVFVLFSSGRAGLPMTGAAAIDLTLAVLFVVAFARTPSS